jgi:hypothetical protein
MKAKTTDDAEKARMLTDEDLIIYIYTERIEIS